MAFEGLFAGGPYHCWLLLLEQQTPFITFTYTRYGVETSHVYVKQKRVAKTRDDRDITLYILKSEVEGDIPHCARFMVRTTPYRELVELCREKGTGEEFD